MSNQNRLRLYLLTSQEASLFSFVNDWLERTPFIEIEGWDFWTAYQLALKHKYDELVRSVPEGVNYEARQAEFQKEYETLKELLEEERWVSRTRGDDQAHLSFKAIKAAVMIHVYREMPIFHLAFQILQQLVEIDEELVTWRWKYAILVL